MAFHATRCALLRRSLRMLCLVLVMQCPLHGFATTAPQPLLLTFSLKEQPITVLLETIEKVSRFKVVYDHHHADLQKKITLAVKDQPLDDVLKAAFRNTRLKYKIIDNYLVVTAEAPVTAPPAEGPAPAPPPPQQDKAVTGTVKGKGGEPLPGVSVSVKGSSTGTQTDGEGKFRLSVPDKDAVLHFTFMGFLPQDLPATPGAVLNIVLEEDVKALEEVIVVGYGTQRRKELTGAVASIKSADLGKLPTTSVTAGLQGKVPGVYVSQVSGAPGAQASVRIRGIGTTGGNQPLYVVDGFPINTGALNIGGSSDRIDGLSIVNPSDIESVEVLKDAAAAAIYGARAANGVILITTKRGKEGITRVNLGISTGVQQLWKKPEYLNAQEFATLANEIHTNSGITPNPEWAEPEKLGKGTDWIDLIFRNALIQEYNIGVTGGNSKLQSALSAGYLKQEGTMTGTWYERYTARANVDYKATDRLRFGGTFSFSFSQAKANTNNEFRLGIFNLAKMMYPTLGPDDVIQGKPEYYTTQGDNPLLRAQSMDQRMKDFRTLLSVYGEWEILNGLKWKTSVGADVGNNRNRSWLDKFERGFARNLSATLNETYTQNYTWLIENTLSYARSFAGHQLNVVLGQSAQKNNTSWISATGIDYLNDQLQVINGSKEDLRRAGGTEGQYALASYFGRVNYDYKGKYLLSASLRRDGSSNFGPRNKWGMFPSVSAGWNVVEEPFLQNVKAIDMLKLRVSWGQLGNDAIGAYNYMSTFRLGNAADNYVLGTGQDLVVGASMLRPGNPDLKWEASEQVNIGLDAAFFKGNVYLTADYYIKNTRNMLVSPPVSIEAGFQNAPFINAGLITNRGLELLLGYRNKAGNFTYDVSGNIATLKNKVVSLGVGQPIVGASLSSYFDLRGTYTEVGMPIGYYRGYQVGGIYQTKEEVNKTLQPNATAGDFRFIDQNGDNKLSDLDKVYLGKPWPDLTYGLNVNLGWKGFDLNLFLQGMAGLQIYNISKMTGYAIKYFGGSGLMNGTRGALDRWTPGSGRNSVPRLTYTDVNGNYFNSSDFYVEDGDFMRVRNLQIGYNLPQQLLQRVKPLHTVRVYLAAQNLFTFTKYSGFDPEIGDTSPLASGIDDGVYPQPRTFRAGLNVGF
ncbi:TonB-dependent receptor [Chitinophaga sp.]|uniref:TonB-dependent receptor n=1 Tax=Chitinophaga sp. TaxID=1869181 RepID=UPI0031D72CA6